MKRIKIIPKKHFDLYLFGSYLYSSDPGDIDLAIIYDKSFITITEALNYRRFLKSNLTKKLSLPIDILLLSDKEQIETEFLNNFKPQIIFRTISNKKQIKKIR